MQRAFDLIIKRLEESKTKTFVSGITHNPYEFGACQGMDKAIEIVNQVASEYGEEVCEWEYNNFEEKWETECGTLFMLHDSDKEVTNYCPCCGKKIKVVEPYKAEREE